MLSYCLKSKKHTKNVDSKALKTKNGRTNVLHVVVKSRDL